MKEVTEKLRNNRCREETCPGTLTDKIIDNETGQIK